jgi:alkylhydroperoxidase/carboxymuconolactone decarboxylase family protein YurZ
MAQARITPEQMREAIQVVAAYGSVSNAAKVLQLSRSTLSSRYQRAVNAPPELLRARASESTE